MVDKTYMISMSNLKMKQNKFILVSILFMQKYVWLNDKLN